MENRFLDRLDTLALGQSNCHFATGTPYCSDFDDCGTFGIGYLFQISGPDPLYRAFKDERGRFLRFAPSRALLRTQCKMS